HECKREGKALNADCCLDQHCEHEHEADFACAHTHEHGNCCGSSNSIMRSSLIHTAQVTLFIFLITLVLNGVIEFVGEEVLAEFLSSVPALSVFASACVGLIPNCAASVVITELFLEGAISTGSMMAGLLVAAGVGLLVLFRANRPTKNNVGIVCVLFVIGVLWGLAFDFLGIVF
ncbi:MAG: putative manganese transporter, partial [Anaerotardibacter sp.]